MIGARFLRILAGGVALAACLSAGIALALAQEEPTPIPPDREPTLRRLFDALGYGDRTVAHLDAIAIELCDGKTAAVESARGEFDRVPVERFVIRQLHSRVDEKTLATLLPILEAPGGKALVQLARATADLSLDEDGTDETKKKTMRELSRGYRASLWKGVGAANEFAILINESVAIQNLRFLSLAQSKLQKDGKIDCDGDRSGEFGTFLELTGVVGVRRGYVNRQGQGGPGSDFSSQGPPLKPWYFLPAFGQVDGEGIVTKNGYCYRIYLPDTMANFVFEKGPAGSVGLQGGDRLVGIDRAEEVWCAYAWPERRGETGSRVFFVNEEFQVLASPNTRTKWDGLRNAPKGNSAYGGNHLEERAVRGQRGADGEVWTKVP